MTALLATGLRACTDACEPCVTHSLGAAAAVEHDTFTANGYKMHPMNMGWGHHVIQIKKPVAIAYRKNLPTAM